MHKLKNNKKFKCLLFLVYLFVITIFSLVTRKYKDITKEYPIDITIINTFTLFFGTKLIYLLKLKEKINYFSFFFLRKHPKKRDNYSVIILLMCMLLFFICEYIFKTNFYKLSSVTVCLFSQSRIVLIFLFSVFVLKNKFTFYQFYGTILTVVSIILGSIKNENKEFCFKSALKISGASLLNGVSNCLFDYFIKKEVSDFLFYLSDANFVHLTLALFIKICMTGQNFSKFLCINSSILLISFLSSLVTVVAIINTLTFNLFERVFICFFAFIVRDLITDIIDKRKNDALRLFSYFLGLTSGIIYKAKEIKILFK